MALVLFIDDEKTHVDQIIEPLKTHCQCAHVDFGEWDKLLEILRAGPSPRVAVVDEMLMSSSLRKKLEAWIEKIEKEGLKPASSPPPPTSDPNDKYISGRTFVRLLKRAAELREPPQIMRMILVSQAFDTLTSKQVQELKQGYGFDDVLVKQIKVEAGPPKRYVVSNAEALAARIRYWLAH